MAREQGPRLAGWGRVFEPGEERVGEKLLPLSEGLPLARGLGRAYGDSALPAAGQAAVLGTRLANRILSWDPDTRLLRGEAGLSLYEVNHLFFNRGFFTPVTPGTQYVTLGGMVAADVHGKNHHVAGCFGEHVTSLRMRVADGRIVDCGPDLEPELFWATVGGMGLTGHILEVEFKMDEIESPWLVVETERIPNFDAFVDGLKDAAENWPFTMGWVDCLSRGRAMGRGVLYRGRWATKAEAPNRAVHPKRRLRHIPRVKRSVQHPEVFFYPLDTFLEWNKLYGPRGFTQYQCVIPEEAGRPAVRRFLERMTELGGSSFLCVIKDCGPQGKGMLSFPAAGTSIALDIPVRSNTQGLVDALNEATLAEGGRMYLAKDSFTRPADFASMEGERLERFNEVRRKWDPELRLRSRQSVRVFGDPR
jgi:FAD/FMN-containing dehydrogenase